MAEFDRLILFDFDGTIAEFRNFPSIGEPRQFMYEAARELKNMGYKIGVWSGRSSRAWSPDPEERKLRTQEMVDFLNETGFPYDVIFGEDSGKVPATAMIDDTAVSADPESGSKLQEVLRK